MMNFKKKVIFYFFPISYLISPVRTLAQYNQLPSSGNDFSIYSLILNFILLAAGIIGAVSVIGLLIAVIFYLSAASSDDRLQLAGSVFVKALVGIIIFTLGITAWYFLKGYLNA